MRVSHLRLISVSFPILSVLTTWILLMALYPDVKSRTPQSQIDQLISQADDSLLLRLKVRSNSSFCDYIWPCYSRGSTHAATGHVEWWITTFMRTKVQVFFKKTYFIPKGTKIRVIVNITPIPPHIKSQSPSWWYPSFLCLVCPGQWCFTYICHSFTMGSHIAGARLAETSLFLLNIWQFFQYVNLS